MKSTNLKKRVVLIIAISSVVLIIVLGLMAMFVPLKNGKPLIYGGTFKDSTSSTASNDNNDQDLHTKTQKLIDSGKLDEAEQVIRKDPKFETDWYTHSLLVDLYLNSNQPDKALETLLDMEKQFGLQHYTAASRIAELYNLEGNSELAVYYYQKAIGLASDSDTPMRQWDIEQLEQKLREVK